jgi:enoyl-CoA hydratase/carnithine racemase
LVSYPAYQELKLKYLGPNGDLDNGPCLNVALDEGVLSLTLNCPADADTTNTALALERLVAVLSDDEAVRVVVLRGNGPTASLRKLVQPIVAMVHGACSADTLALLEACDIVICADDARFAVPGSSSNALNAQEAQRQGLVSLCVPTSELQAQTDQLARELSGKDAMALRFTKQTLQRVPNIPWAEVLAFTSAKQAELKALQAGQPSARASAIASFLAGKSKPGAGA